MNMSISTVHFKMWFVTLVFVINQNTLAQDLSWSNNSDVSAAGENAYAPQISLSSDGSKAIAIWGRLEGDRNYIIQSRSATISGNTATWGAVADLSKGGQAADRQQISLSFDGSKATAVWQRYNGSNYIIQSRSATIIGNTATWGAVTSLSVTGKDAYNPQVSLSSDGSRAIAVWTRSNGLNSITQSRFATISGNTPTWGAVTNLSVTGEDAYNPQISLSSDGSKATIVWQSFIGTIFEGFLVAIQSRSATIGWGAVTWSAITDLTTSGANASRPQLSLSSDGSKATVVWQNIAGGNTYTIQVIRSSSATISGYTADWGAATNLAGSGINFGFIAKSPQISLSSDGSKATAVWQKKYNDSEYFPNHIIQSSSATISGNTTTWSAITDLSAAGAAGQNDRHQQITLSSDGSKAIAVWRRYNGLNYIIQSRSATISGNTATWGAVVNLSKWGEDAYNPQISLSSDGSKATAVWSEVKVTKGYEVPNRIIQSASAIAEAALPAIIMYLLN